MLREPVDRVISHYYHACRDKDNMSLKDFMLNDLERSYNLQTRYCREQNLIATLPINL
jgi:hypothetical protein